MALGIYTPEEIKEFIKAIDLKLNKGIKMSELNTSQSEQEFQIEQKELRNQRNYWIQLYKSETGNDGGIVSLQAEGFTYGN